MAGRGNKGDGAPTPDDGTITYDIGGVTVVLNGNRNDPGGLIISADSAEKADFMRGILIERLHSTGKNVAFSAPPGEKGGRKYVITFNNPVMPPGSKLKPLTYDDIKGVMEKIRAAIPNRATLLVGMVQRNRELTARGKAAEDHWVGQEVQPYVGAAVTYLASIGKPLVGHEIEGLTMALVEERKRHAARGGGRS